MENEDGEGCAGSLRKGKNFGIRNIYGLRKCNMIARQQQKILLILMFIN